MLKSRKEIKEWLEEMEVKNYVIHDDLTVTVLGRLDISSRNLSEIPVVFREITGALDCCNNPITKLEGLPDGLKELDISNTQIKSLKGLPSSLEMLDCSSTEIQSLEGLPKGLVKLYCYHSRIKSVKGLPSGLKWLNCSDNNITSLENLPDGLRYLDCSDNNIINGCALPATLTRILTPRGSRLWLAILNKESESTPESTNEKRPGTLLPIHDIPGVVDNPKLSRLPNDRRGLSCFAINHERKAIRPSKSMAALARFLSEDVKDVRKVMGHNFRNRNKPMSLQGWEIHYDHPNYSLNYVNSTTGYKVYTF